MADVATEEFFVDHPDTSVFRVVPAGEKWGVATDEEVLVLTNSRREAEALVDAATRVLARKAPWRARIAPEPRSFKDDA